MGMEKVRECVFVLCVEGCGFEKGARFHGGHAFECTAHVGRKVDLEAKGTLQQLQRGLTGGRNAWVFKGVPMWYLWFSEGSSG